MDIAKKSKNAGMYVCIHYRYLSKLMKPPWKAVQNFLKKKISKRTTMWPICTTLENIHKYSTSYYKDTFLAMLIAHVLKIAAEWKETSCLSIKSEENI